MAVRELRGGLAWAGLFSLGLNLLMLAVPLYSMQLFDRVLGSGRLETLALLSLAAGLALVTLGLLDALRANLLGRVAARFEVALAPAAVEAGFAEVGAGRALRDLAGLRQALTGPAVAALFDVPWLPLSLLAIWILDPRLAAFVGASAVLLLLLAVANDLATGRLARDGAELQQQALALADAVQRRREAVLGLSMLGLAHRPAGPAERRGPGARPGRGVPGGAVAGATRCARLLVQCGVMALSAWLVLVDALSPGRCSRPRSWPAGPWPRSSSSSPPGAASARRRRLAPPARQLRASPRLDRLPMPDARGALEVEAATVRAVDGRTSSRWPACGSGPAPAPSSWAPRAPARARSAASSPARSSRTRARSGSTVRRCAATAARIGHGRWATCRRT
jgi:hypothetical protein